MTSAASKARPRPKDVERRAYFIWLDRGCLRGNELSNWLEAEEQLESELELEDREVLLQNGGAPPRTVEQPRKGVTA